MKIIPTSTDQNYSQVTTLSGRDYIFTFHWNKREGAWYVDIADQDGVLIAASRKIVVDFRLLTRTIDDRQPEGVIVAIDLSGQGRDPGLEDMGTRVVLGYFEAEDFADEAV